METFDHTDDLQGATFTATNLRGAHFIRADLSGAVMRGVDLSGADIDAPWLAEDGSTLLINGVDVVPLVEAELNRRFTGRAERRGTDPGGLRNAWARLEQAWDLALERAAVLPASAVEVQVDGEWSFTQTLQHLVMATDTWLRKAILEIEQPYHPLGQPNAEFETDGYDLSVFATEPPRYEEVLEARKDRQAMVRNFLATVTPADLDAERRNPWAPDHPVTVRSCLHTILNEEWDHLRYALRDLDAVERGAVGTTETETHTKQV